MDHLVSLASSSSLRIDERGRGWLLSVLPSPPPPRTVNQDCDLYKLRLQSHGAGKGLGRRFCFLPTFEHFITDKRKHFLVLFNTFLNKKELHLRNFNVQFAFTVRESRV